MANTASTIVVMRRIVLRAAAWSGLGLAGIGIPQAPSLGETDNASVDYDELVKRLIGNSATLSPRVHLIMPAAFGNGYSVPCTLAVDSPMTENDHVRRVHVLAPKNPIIVVGTFHFTPQSGSAAVSTRIRLAEPQMVLAVAEMNDGALLMARTWVKVETDGCA
jgi:sulfur-oxidizing protein SoxY